MTRVNQLTAVEMMGDHGLLLCCFTVLHAIYSWGVAGGAQSLCWPPKIHTTGEAAQRRANVTQPSMGIAQELTGLKRLQLNLRNRQAEDHGTALGNSEIQYG